MTGDPKLCATCGAAIVFATWALDGSPLVLDAELAVYHVVQESPPLAQRARGTRILALHRCPKGSGPTETEPDW